MRLYGLGQVVTDDAGYVVKYLQAWSAPSISVLCILTVVITNVCLGISERRYPNKKKRLGKNKYRYMKNAQKNARRLKSIESALQN